MIRIIRIALACWLALVTIAGCAVIPGAVDPTETAVRKLVPTSAPIKRIPEANEEILVLTDHETAPVDVLPLAGTYFLNEKTTDIMEAECSKHADGPTWCNPMNGAELTVTSTYKGAVCGVSQETRPNVLLQTSEYGVFLMVNVTASVYKDCWLFDFQPSPGMVLGKYRVTFEQDDLLLEDTFNLALPTQPSATRVDGCALFAGFQNGLTWFGENAPKQKIRVVLFGALYYSQHKPPMDPDVTVWVPVAEREYTVDRGGMLKVCLDEAITKQFFHVTMAAQANDEEPVYWGDADVGQVFFSHACKGSAETRLKMDANARVVLDNLEVTDMPVTNRDEIKETLHTGDSVFVLDGPLCTDDGFFMWKVRTPSGYEGWVIEVDGNTYNLEPE